VAIIVSPSFSAPWRVDWEEGKEEEAGRGYRMHKGWTREKKGKVREEQSHRQAPPSFSLSKEVPQSLPGLKGTYLGLPKPLAYLLHQPICPGQRKALGKDAWNRNLVASCGPQ
jgi:hypothetical protein